MIQKIALNNKILIPQLGLGTGDLKGDDCIKTIKSALNLNYKLIDTAESYYNEDDIGEAIKNYFRNELFITTKISPINLTYNDVLASCEESLARLQTDYIDIYLIHWPDKSLNFQEIIKAMKYLYDEKKIKSFGVSNFTINHLENLLKITNKLNLPLSINQVEFNPGKNQKELLNFCNNHEIKIMAYSPLNKGEILRSKTLKDLSVKYNKSPAQIVLRWLLDKGLIVIPKASSEKHLRENIDLNFNLDYNDKIIIDNIDNNINN